MPYTAAQLTTIYTNIHAGLAPNAAQQALINAYAAQNNAGTLTDAQVLQNVIDTADSDSAVAIQAYQFFTGTAPSAAGLAYLVNSAANPTDLNDPYYQNFNITNRYINFAANLGTGTGAGATSFQAAYGGLTIAQSVDLAYETVIGTANAQAAGIDVTAAKAYITSQLPYFTALANQNFPTATAAQKDLVIKSEIVGYIMSAAIQANVGAYSAATSALLADLGPDNTATLGADLLGSYAATSVTLTAFGDTKSANVFNAPRGFTPGGTDQINTLNDDDNLTGVGSNPTLNFTYVNDADTSDYYIVPTMTNVQTVNVAFATDNAATLDVEDSTGIKAVNITRISGNGPSASIVNLTSIPTLSISNSNAPSSSVYLEFLASTVAGAADATTLTLSNVNVANLYIEQTGQGAGLDEGIETLTIVSTGAANKIGTLEAEDLKTLTLTGGQKLTLGSTGNDINAGIPGLIEATRYGAGLANVAGSLTTIDASAMTASLDITLGAEANTTTDGTSGTPLNLKVTGGSGNDTFRLSQGVNAAVGATIDGGAGTDTLALYSSSDTTTLTKGAFTNLEALDVRSGQDAGSTADTITVDTSLFAGLTGVTVRNEGMFFTPAVVGPPAVPGFWSSAPESGTFNLNKLSAAAATGITVLHGTTGNNGIIGAGTTTIVATLATDTASDTVGLTIKDGINNDPRSNFVLTAGTGATAGATGSVESITINDLDSESNTVALTNVAAMTGTLTLTGGQVGNFLNLDSTIFAGVKNFAGGMQRDVTGAAVDGKAWHDFGAGAGDQVIATTISASTFAGDVIVRVGNPAGAAGAQSITLGTGNDTVIFDTVTGVGNTTAGLSISDTVAGGAGSDALVIDGNGAFINISASEWTNVTGFETLRLVGNGGGAFAGSNAIGALNNAYNITLTNAFLTANNTTTGGIQRIAIINDNDPTNDATGVSTAVDASPNNGLTLDARQLDATHSFSYNGEEGAGATADRFIMSDANINGAAIIDGGYAAFGTNAGNTDILEVRNAAVVTIGDLANVKNVGTIAFTNDTASVQSSVLQLDTATIDALVNSTHATKAGEVETLHVVVQGNTLVTGAATQLTIDATSLDTTKANFDVTSLGGATVVTITGSTFGAAITGSAGADNITGSANNDTITPGEGADTVNGGAGNDTINLTEVTAAADTVILDQAFVAGGSANADIISGFAAGAGADLLQWSANNLLNGTTLATTDLAAIAPVAVASNGTATANDVIFTFSGAGDLLPNTTTVANAVANAVTALTSGTDFASANVATGDSFLLLMSDGANTWVFNYIADGTPATTTAADLSLVAEIVGVLPATFATGDFI